MNYNTEGSVKTGDGVKTEDGVKAKDIYIGNKYEDLINNVFSYE